MANPWFKFKQFTINQDRSAFKVGTDGVLLGAWADTEGVKSVLDIGTGTGLLALMIAQRSDATITAIEIDRASCEQAIKNARESPWSDRIDIIHASLKEYAKEDKFDLIVSNPPYFQDSLHPESESLRISKHNVFLSLDNLVKFVPQLMKKRSRFCLILPVEESLEFEKLGEKNGLFLHRVLEVRPNQGLPARRRLMQFQLESAERIIREELHIEKGKRHDYSEEYKLLTREFYLKF